MKTLSPLQIRCLQDAIAKGELSRSKGFHDFTGNHKGQTVASLIENGSLKVLETNGADLTLGYPLRVAIVPESDLVKAVGLIGKSVTTMVNGKIQSPLLVTAVGVKDKIVHVQFTNFFRRLDMVVNEQQEVG